MQEKKHKQAQRAITSTCIKTPGVVELIDMIYQQRMRRLLQIRNSLPIREEIPTNIQQVTMNVVQYGSDMFKCTAIHYVAAHIPAVPIRYQNCGTDNQQEQPRAVFAQKSHFSISQKIFSRM